MACEAEILDLGSLARYRLPINRYPNEAYRLFVPMERYFVIAVETLESNGELALRDDHTYRPWDLYTIADLLIRHTKFEIHGTPGIAARPNALERPFEWDRPPEEWWEAADAVRNGQIELDQEFYHTPIVQDTGTLQPRAESGEERATRIANARVAMREAIDQISATLPADVEYWRRSLSIHAAAIVSLRRNGMDGLARLCADHFSAAVRLATARLGVTRRELRAVVGKIQSDMRYHALTLMSYSPVVQGFDVALDMLEDSLQAFNAAVPPELQLAQQEPELMLRYLSDTGLQQWYVELSAVGWQTSNFFDQSYLQRVAMGVGRIRTMCVLMEEALLAMAERVQDTQFIETVESNTALAARVAAFIQGPQQANTLLRVAPIEDLNRRYNMFAARHRPILRQDIVRNLGTSMDGYGIGAGDSPPGVPQPVPEHLFAGFVFLRNLISHRYPIVVDGELMEWFEHWEKRLPAINRLVEWTALLTWSLTNYFRAGQGNVHRTP